MHHRYPEYLSNAIKKSLGIKTVVTVHNFVSGLKQFSYKSDCIIAINNSVKDHLVTTFHLDAEKIKVLYNCVRREDELNLKKEGIKSSLDISLESTVILYLGRIVLEKGIDLLIDAYKSLLKPESCVKR